MALSPLKYSNIIFDNTTLDLSIPRKINGVYTSNILYNNSSLLIQTPILNHSDHSTLTFEMVNNGNFFTLFESLSNHVIEHLYVNSKEFFNGKEFNQERITESLVKLVNVNESGQVKLNVVETGMNKKSIINILNEKIDQPAFPIQGKFILEIKNITFSKKEFRINIYIKNIKLCPKKVSKQVINFDLDLSDSETDDPLPEKVTESDTVEIKVEEPKAVEIKVEEPTVQEIEVQEEIVDEPLHETESQEISQEELIVDKPNVDDLDFFE